MLTHLDLCSGIGGFTIASGWAGFVTMGFSEVDPYCCALLKEKWPLVPNYGDLRRADFSRLRGRVDVLSAGVPCQPASCAGKRRGEKDDRWLWGAVLDVVGSVRPAWCIFENPPGIITLDEFGGVLLRLGAIGYGVRLFSVPANAIGAKHRRQRVFVVAHAERRDDERRWARWGEAIGERACDAANGSGIESEALADASCGGRDGWRPNAGDLGECERDERRRVLESERCGETFLEFRLTEPPLCRRVDGVRGRSHRLKALGNSVVPQVAYPFFSAIAQTIFLSR